MIRSLLCGAAFLVASFTAFGQYEQTSFQGAEDLPMTFLGESPALIDLVNDPNMVHPVVKHTEPGYTPKSDWPQNPHTNPNALPQGVDPVLQMEYPQPDPTKSSQPIGLNINGMSDTGFSPADPTMDVGPNHFVQMINGQSGARVQIYDKAGTILVPNFYLDLLFNNDGAGDPVVFYDELADRWVLTEFQPQGLQNKLYVAVSTTADPTGTYWLYEVVAPSFPDYPHYSVWNDAYLITTNENVPACYAMNRTNMLSGLAAQTQRFALPLFGTLFFQTGTPVSLSGTTLPPGGQPGYIMRMRDDGWSGVTSDALEMWEFDIDFANAANTTLSLEEEIFPSPFDSNLCTYTGFSCVPQPGTGVQLDPLLEVLMNRVYYRNFGSHESIVCTHTIDVDGTDRAGLRWYELRRFGGTGGTWSIYQEGTYSPDTDGRFMGSIAIDENGSIALAYNVSSSTTFPSLRYTGRVQGSPLGTMPQVETTIVAGGGSNFSNRYGDYNQLNWDAAGGNFWFTGMYNPSSAWSTRICEFSLDLLVANPGCTDASACNFDEFATEDDGSCTYPGCLSSSACNYDPTAACDSGDCCFENCIFVDQTDGFGDGWDSGIWEIQEALSGTPVASGTLEAGLTGQDLACLVPGCYFFHIPAGGNFPSEIGWSLSGSGIDGSYSGGFGDVAYFSVGDDCSDVGCTSDLACNFLSTAIFDDGSCCFDNCLVIDMTDSFGDGWNNNFWEVYKPGTGNVVATGSLGDGASGQDIACLTPGCYGFRINQDNGSFPSEIEWTITGGDDGPLTGDAFDDFQFTIAGGGTDVGCTDPVACNYSGIAICDNGTCCFGNCGTMNMTDGFGDGWNGGSVQLLGDVSYAFDLPSGSLSEVEVCIVDGCYDLLTVPGIFPDEARWTLELTAPIPFTLGGDLNPNPVSDFSLNQVDGCTDPVACNYNAAATCDDCCEYQTCAGCTDPAACNWSEFATIDDGSCDFGLWYIPDAIGGNPGVQACAPPAGYSLANQDCILALIAADPFCMNSGWDSVCQWGYECCLNGGGCNDPLACNFGPNNLCPEDNTFCEYPGCDDPSACNYDSAAACSDGSCDYGCYGCTYPDALNFTPGATLDDSSCVFPNNDCPTDLDGDGFTQTADLIALLAAFGTPCPMP